MQRGRHLCILFATVLALTLPAMAHAEWAAACHGQIPHGAIAQGYEASGEPLWIARAALSAKGHHAGTHPGKVRPAFNGANIPYGGKEIQASCYEVWVGAARWVAASGGRIPQGAVVAGQEADGQYLYVARGVIQGGLHIGKVRPDFGAANIPYGGRELKVTTYEVLVH